MTPKLSPALKCFYAAGNFGFTILISATGFFLLIFYTDVAMVPPALAGAALLIGKIWDTVNDPLFGWITDRTRSRHGRRRVYLIYGALPLAIATFLLWMIPQGLSPVWKFVWILFTYSFFDTMFTITYVPYSALAPELASDYDDRTSLMAVTSIGAVLGYMAGSIAMPLVLRNFTNARTGYAAAGLIFGIIVAACIALVVLKIRERSDNINKVSTLPILTSIITTFRNRSFVMLITAFGLVRLALTLLQTVLAYYVTYQIHLPQSIPRVLTVLMVTVAFFIFLWKKISDRWSKATAYAVGLTLTATAGIMGFWIQKGQMSGLMLFIIVAGIGLSAHWVLPWAMMPDVIEHDEASTGQRREGMYYGVYGLVDKLARTLATTAAGLGLHYFGYVANVEQTQRSLFGIRLLFGPIPAVLLLMAIPFLIYYPITRTSHAKLREQLGK